MVTVILFVIVILLAIWVGVLTSFFWNLSGHYNNLVRGTNKKTLQTILDSLVADMHTSKKDIEMLTSLCDTIKAESKFYIQRIGLIRFNPFKDTGGDQSFILSLLDGNDTGVVISGLYSRSGTRWYAKRVRKSVGVEHELSDEEKQAVKEAKPLG